MWQFLGLAACFWAPAAHDLWSEGPELESRLAWLVDEEDPALVSRGVMILEAGSTTPELLVAPVLRCFDAHDGQALAWAGDQLLFNGPVTHHREAPNVPMPLQRVGLEGEGHGALHGWSGEFRVAPDQSAALCWRAFGLDVVELTDFDGDPRSRTILGEEQLGRSYITGAVWSEDSEFAYVTVRGVRDGLESGLWRVSAAGEGHERVGRGATRLVARCGTGLLLLQRDGRDLRSSHTLWRTETEQEIEGSTERRSTRLTSGLRYDTPVAVDEVHGRVAVVRDDDGALVVIDAAEEDKILTVLGVKLPPVRSADWSPGGNQLTLGTRVAGAAPEVIVLDASLQSVLWRTPGLRPAW